MERQEVSLLEEELEELRNRLLEMGALVESTTDHSVFSLVEEDIEQARGVKPSECGIKQTEIAIDHLSARRLALQQLATTDLRFITAAIKINDELERVEDLTVNISERARALIQELQAEPLTGIPHMTSLAESMVRKALAAFVNRDGASARAVLASRDALRGLLDALYRELLSFMEKDPERIAQGVNLPLVARNLERIADHAANIAEDVLFLVQGFNEHDPAKAHQ
jgi:phosphate transport system protein